MTRSLDEVLERVNRMPAERQDEIAAMIGRIIDAREPAGAGLTAAHWAEVDRRLAVEPTFASDEDVQAFFRTALA